MSRGSRSDQRGHVGQDQTDAPARWTVHPRGESTHRVVPEHRSAVVAPGGRDRTQVPQARNRQRGGCLGGASGVGAQGRPAPTGARPAHGQDAVRADSRPGLRRQLRPRDALGAGLARRAGRRTAACSLRADELRARRRLPVRLELRVRLRRWPAPPAGGRAHQARQQPRLLADGLPDAEPRDAVRRPRTRLPGAGRHPQAGRVRQHEDRGRQGRRRQAALGQRALPGHVLALPVRARVLQPGLRLGEGHRREERARPPAPGLARSERTALARPGHAQCLARRALPRLLGRDRAPRVAGIDSG
mmetsp:Transcript_59148/g.139275  ORF Transcript_59148/g.139275 Transcript_59148/m.139275 type:complete len:303 (-) Transcript_59148:8985-9893(-)